MALRTWGLVLGLVLSVCGTYGESDGSKLPPELRTAFAEFEAEAAGAEHAHGRKLVIAFDSFQKNAKALTDADTGLSREKRANAASRGVQKEMPALDGGRSKQATVASHVRSVLSADDSGGGCTSTCLNMTCDEWVMTYDYTCGWLESEFSCSCAGCSTCEGGDGGGSDDHGGDDQGDDDYDDLYEIVELLDDDDNGGSSGGDGDDYAGDDYDGDDSGSSFRYENLTTLADRCCLGVPEDGAVFTCYMPEVCGEGGAPTPTLPPTTIPLPVPTAVPVPAPSAVPLPTPSSKPTPLAVLSALVTVGLAGFSCSDYTDAEATVLELAVGDVTTTLQSTEATGCTSNRRRLTGMGTQHLRHRRRLLEDSDSSIDMTITAFAHHTNSTTSSEFADEFNDVLTSAVSTGSLASAISSRASDAGVTTFSSVSVSSATVSTHSPTAQPTRFPPPTPKPTGVYCTDGVQNGDETSTDCGGSCSTCAFGESCGVDSDCASSTCQGGVCITSPPTAAPTLACEDLEFTPPQLQEAKFSSTAGQLFLTWSLNTDRAGLGGASFECDQLLDFPAVSYATCVWTSQQSLTVSGLHPGQSGVVNALVLIDLP